MSILDSQGRIFGKINLIDALVILIILLIVVGGGLRVALGLEFVHRADLIEMVVRVEAPVVRKEFAERLTPGGAIRPARAVEDGEILSVDLHPPQARYLTTGDFLEPVDPQDYARVELEFKGMGEIYSNSYYLEGERIFLGEEISLEAGEVFLRATVMEVKPFE
ncbi:MAG: DUF4330 domain-containing protein [Candidatus Syntrophonatronum acetioxidans]|uniref:DUF4330 domain-containing protein n=1 Tax=Candidatus Syntrophonatronum acetioxidans TaxID=1795816 RepID=A0A424YFX6_9FIRM|nr:MAG: DUF4330 domain-containing protein [Candidatus Syntrophonatronum acetioxidans]